MLGFSFFLSCFFFGVVGRGDLDRPTRRCDIYTSFISPAVPTVNKAPRRRLRPQCGMRRSEEEVEEVGVGELGGCYSREKTAGNDKGCKYLPLPGPGSLQN